MPLYEYACPGCGIFEARGRYDEDEMECACGEQARRIVSRPNFVIAGRSIPRADDKEALRQEWKGELQKRGWNGERAVEEMRRVHHTDLQGQHLLETGKLPKEAP